MKSKNKPIIPVPKEKRTEPYWNLLNNVVDPEVGIGIVDLGLVYDVEIKDDVALVTMTLTSIGCPQGPEIIAQVQDEMEKFEGIKRCDVNIVWDPVWTHERMDEDMKQLLFGF